MTALPEAPFSYTIKVGPQGNLLTVRAETYTEMVERLGDLKNLHDILTGAVPAPATDPVAVATEVLGATVIETTETPVAEPTAPAPVASAAPVGSPEVVSDKYGAQYTYGLAEAPALPDGRGYYVKKAWTSQKGKRLTAWVDPIKGPKPFPKGADEAELIWI